MAPERSEAILDQVRTGFSFRTETFNPMRDPIPELYKRRTKFIPERDRLTSRLAHA